MNAKERFDQIVNWYLAHKKEDTRSLRKQKEFEQLAKVEALMGEELPEEITELYTHYDGSEGEGYGVFLGHDFITLEKMLDSLSFSKTLLKPTHPTIKQPEKSEAILTSIIALYRQAIPQKKKLGFIKQKWHKFQFDCAPNSLGGPYLYTTPDPTSREHFKLPSESQEKIYQLTQDLHKLELESYNWDKLEVSVNWDGSYTADRSFYNFDEELPLSSFPKNAIKKKYFHIKWLPILSDFGGNYIGIDLDPDMAGKKGQVIVFGRDEEAMFVIADSWEEFLDFTWAQIEKDADVFNPDSHLNDIYKRLVGADKK